MTTALLPARHGSFVIYRPLRFHVIEILVCFSLRTDRKDTFRFPFSIVSFVRIYIPSRTNDNKHPTLSTRCLHRGVSIPRVFHTLLRSSATDLERYRYRIVHRRRIEFFGPILFNGWIVEERIYRNDIRQ